MRVKPKLKRAVCVTLLTITCPVWIAPWLLWVMCSDLYDERFGR